MKKHIFLLVVVLISLKSYSQTKNFIDKPYLETTSVVDTLVTPDRIYLSIFISEKDTKGRTSVEELENKMDAKLISLGIDTKKQLTLSDTSTNFKKYFLRGTDILKNKLYSLLVYDAKTVGKVISGLEKIGIANVVVKSTKYSKIEQLKIELKQKAVLKAKKQAEAMLKPLNQNVGKALYISDLNSNFYQSSGIRVRGFSSKNLDNAEPIDIEFQKIKVESSVMVKFEIE
ncbi:MAG: SIMPL domain-containing protein [Tenacibaculum sp.]|nr:SIMPL domain-containing protein [Tenacibaculum sp.]